MSAAVFHHRRIERFARLLDGAEGTGSRRHGRDPLDDELSEYVALGRALPRFPMPADATPDPDFRVGLRAMLVATAEREGIGSADDADHDGVYEAAAAAKRQFLGGKRTRGAIIVGIAAGTLALSGMSMASGDALPGDPLYGVKRSTENARLALAGSDIDRGQAYLGFAKNRAAEAAGVRSNPNRLLPALSDMNDETTQGVRLLTTAAMARRDPAALGMVDEFVKAQRPAVAALLPGLSGASLEHAQQSLTLLDQIGARVAGLRAGLSCANGTSKTDALGPVPPACASPSTAGQNKPGGRAGAAAVPGTGQSAVRPESSPTTTPYGPSATADAPSGDAASPAPSSGGGLLGDLGHLLGSLF